MNAVSRGIFMDHGVKQCTIVYPKSDWGLIRGRAICDMKGAHLIDDPKTKPFGRRGPCVMTQWHNGQSDSECITVYLWVSQCISAYLSVYHWNVAYLSAPRYIAEYHSVSWCISVYLDVSLYQGLSQCNPVNLQWIFLVDYTKCMTCLGEFC